MQTVVKVRNAQTDPFCFCWLKENRDFGYVQEVFYFEVRQEYFSYAKTVLGKKSFFSYFRQMLSFCLTCSLTSITKTNRKSEIQKVMD